MEEGWVFIKVLDNSWNLVKEFKANWETSISSQANNNDCDVAVACCSGACLVCSCQVIEWMKYIDNQKFWSQLANPWDWQILSCVSWIKDEFLSDNKKYEIVLQKII